MKKLFICFLAVFILSCCAVNGTAKKFGSFVIYERIGKEFDAALISSGYGYFYFGSQEYPRALLAVKKGYLLATDVWTPAEMDAKRMSRVIGNMQAKDNYSRLKGYRLLDTDGNEVGKWYSQMRLTTAVELLGDNKIVVYPPDAEGTGNEGTIVQQAK